MASVLLYLGILFTIAVPIISAQGPHNAEDGASNEGHGASNEGYGLDTGLSLVTAPFRVVVQGRAPVLLNCSIEITDKLRPFPLKFSWFKDDKVIDFSKQRPRAQLLSNGSLLLRPRRKKSKGRSRILDGLYSCHVNTTQGNVIARRVEVVVASIDRNFTKDPVSQEVREGSVARFECSIRATPLAFYVWNRNNSQLSQDDPRISILPSGVVHIRNVKMSDAGRYWCQATLNLRSGTEQMTDLRWVSSRDAQLKVIPGVVERPLRIVAPPKNTSVSVGDTAYLECLGDAWPNPVVTTWKRRRGAPIVSDGQAANLVLYNVVPSLAGVYECVLTSGRKTVSAFATLSVIEPPKVMQIPQSRRYPMAMTFALECKVEGKPTPTISWYHEGVPIRKSEGNVALKDEKLLFYNAVQDNSGFYQCMANNSAGEANSVSYVKVDFFGQPPEQPYDVSAAALSSTEIRLNWTHKPTANTTHYIILIDETGHTQHSYMCTAHSSLGDKHSCRVKDGLAPYTTYSFGVQAFSPKSGSLTSEMVKVTTLEDVPKAFPVIDVSSPRFDEVNVSWTPLSAFLSRGKVIQYKLLYRKDGDVNDEKVVDVPAPKTSHIINDFVPDIDYEFLVIAGTKMGFTDLDPISTPWVLYKTPKLKGWTTPHFNLLFVNMTSVMLHWSAPTNDGSGQVTAYTVEYWLLGSKREEEDRIELSGDATSYTLYGLAEDKTYEVTLIATMVQGPASPTTREFRMSELSDNLVPRNVVATSITSDSITISWSPVPRTDLQYEICYGKVGTNKTCHIRDSNSFQITGEPFTGYEFVVRALTQNWEGKFSHVKRVDTEPGLPSPPVNLTVALLKEGSVVLQWQRPSQPKGDIVSYLIQYGKRGDSDEIDWKQITVSGGANTYQIDDLDPEEYLFKLSAQTRAKQGKYTPAKPFKPVCRDNFEECKAKPPPIPIQPIKPPDERLEKKAGTYPTLVEWIAIGLGVSFIVFTIVMVYCCRKRCKKNRDLDPNTSHAPIYPSSNGHIPSVYTHMSNNGNHRPANGHAYPLRQTNVDTRNLEFTPMIQIDEHDLPDSKGDSDTFLIPNGVRMNGYIKYYPHNRPALSSITRLHGDSISTEEMRGLMSGDGTTLILPSLDDMDGSGGGNVGVGRVMLHRGEDHSSEDSGTGSSRAPARFIGSRSNSNSQGLASPASSPGSCSSHDASNNTLTRLCHRLHHHHHDASIDGFERWGDDIGGVRIDPSTGTVIEMMESPQQHRHQLETQQRPSSSTLSSSTGCRFTGNDDQVVWVKGGGVDGSGGGACSEDEDNDMVDREGDRDSGHGSEVKMNHTTNTTTTNTPSTVSGDIDLHCEEDIDYLPTYTTSSSTRQHSCDTGNNNINDNENSDNNSLVVLISSPGDSQQLSLPLPPPSPPPPPLSTTTASTSSSPSSSSQQLWSVNPTTCTTNSSSRNKKHSNSKLPLSSPSSSTSSSSPSSPSTRRVSNRLDNSSTSECYELPPPPPPPPTITTATPSQAADDEGSSTTPHGQLGTMGVFFSPSPPSPPLENGSQSKWRNLSPNIA